MKIGIIGAGAWGGALAVCCANSGNRVVLWSYDKNDADFINKNAEISSLPGIKLSPDIIATGNMADLQECDTWLIAVPSEHFRQTIKNAGVFWKNKPIIICTKGLETGSWNFMSEILKQELPDAAGSIGVLSGPQFAAEVAREVPTGSTLAGSDIVINAGKIALSQMYLQVSNDIIGTEICGVGKNAVAILAGFYSVRATGENEKALKLTIGWDEVVQFGLKMGAKCETFVGLAGLGDLFLSATSKTSRNFSAGVSIAQGNNPQLNGTVEGINAIFGLAHRGKIIGIEMPNLATISNQINKSN